MFFEGSHDNKDWNNGHIKLSFAITEKNKMLLLY